MQNFVSKMLRFKSYYLLGLDVILTCVRFLFINKNVTIIERYLRTTKLLLVANLINTYYLMFLLKDKNLRKLQI